ncbi:MAG: glycosyltransferase family 4 protein [Fimbriimonas sp.]|nr:glycosyltransferase family 4 protein [Fimbriimonas sp.]
MKPHVDKSLPSVSKIAILGNYPPRRCGIATFTADLTNALLSVPTEPQVDVIAMSDATGYAYSDAVRYEIPQQDILSYRRASKILNDESYDVLSVQHEYGIFGGDTGRFLLTLLRESRLPIVVTLHTVLRQPSPSQKAILAEILELSERVIVMSGRAVEILGHEYGLGPEKIDLIPHGIPDFSPLAGRVLRTLLNIPGPMLLTFGLLSPGKGIEYVIRALPAIVAKYPDATYVVLGATHPHVKALSGETYRESLERLAESLGVAENVRFVNEFVTSAELTAYLGAADIYISPYIDREQITSGTLAYAVGAGKCVISTPYPYAEELLAEGRGILVPFMDPAAISEAVFNIVENTVQSQEMARQAASHGETMRWSEVARRTMECFSQAVLQRPSGHASAGLSYLVRSRIPTLQFEHLYALTNDVGIFQHATFTVPNRSEGYCVDDNARALMLTAYIADERPLTAELARSQALYLAFVCDAFNPATGRFRNFMDYGHRWLEEAGSEDSQGRSLWALGTIIGRCPIDNFRKAACLMFERGCDAIADTTSPRTWAYAVLGAIEVLRTSPLDEKAIQLRNVSSDRLHELYNACSTEHWQWFEETLTYGNARLSQALIVAGQARGNMAMVSAGIESLSWLAKKQTAESGVFAPIGTQSYFSEQSAAKPSGSAMFDQQPLEAWDSISAYLAAYDATSDSSWLHEADRAYGWFLGDNMLGTPLYDAVSGGCRDGLHEDRTNENQGAESTLAFLCASLEMRQATGVVVVPNALAL